MKVKGLPPDIVDPNARVRRYCCPRCKQLLIWSKRDKTRGLGGKPLVECLTDSQLEAIYRYYQLDGEWRPMALRVIAEKIRKLDKGVVVAHDGSRARYNQDTVQRLIALIEPFNL